MSTVMVDEFSRHRFTVSEYYRMAEVGLLARDARVELIEGEIIDMPPIGIPHASITEQLRRLFDRAVGEAALVWSHPVRLSQYSEPVPDISLLKPRDDFYARQRVMADDALLVIEVSDSSFMYDRNIKVPLYARHGIPEVWILDVKRSTVWFFRSLADKSYSDVSSVAVNPKSGSAKEAALMASPTLLPGVEIDLQSLVALAINSQ